MKRFTLTILLAAPCVGAQLAHAESASPIPLHARVRYADLNLTRIEGAEALYRRLHAAARHVCAPLDERPLLRPQPFRACVAEAMSHAVAQVDQPLLTSYYRARLDGRATLDPRVATR